MRKIFILIAIVMLLSGCNDDFLMERTDAPEISVPREKYHSFYVVEIDGCEYIKWKDGRGYTGFTHKGNCKYCSKSIVK